MYFFIYIYNTIYHTSYSGLNGKQSFWFTNVYDDLGDLGASRSFSGYRRQWE